MHAPCLVYLHSAAAGDLFLRGRLDTPEGGQHETLDLGGSTQPLFKEVPYNATVKPRPVRAPTYSSSVMLAHLTLTGKEGML